MSDPKPTPPPPTVVYAKERRRQRNRVIAITVFSVTAVLYSTFLVKKFIALTNEKPEIRKPGDIETVNASFFDDEANLTDEEYVAAADAADAELLNKVRRKYTPQDINMQKPRSYWYNRVKELEAEKEKIDSPPHPGADTERQLLRLKNVREDKPEA